MSKNRPCRPRNIQSRGARASQGVRRMSRDPHTRKERKRNRRRVLSCEHRRGCPRAFTLGAPRSPSHPRGTGARSENSFGLRNLLSRHEGTLLCRYRLGRKKHHHGNAFASFIGGDGDEDPRCRQHRASADAPALRRRACLRDRAFKLSAFSLRAAMRACRDHQSFREPSQLAHGYEGICGGKGGTLRKMPVACRLHR